MSWKEVAMNKVKPIQVGLTFAGVVGGTFAVALYFFVAGSVFGWIYNRFDRAGA